MDTSPTEVRERGGRGRYRAPALEKGLDILELLAEQGEGLSQKEICHRLGRSASELFRMLICLERRGYIALSAPDDRPGDRYVLTLKLFELSNHHPPVKRLISEALPVMKALARDLGQSCHLVVAHDGRGLVVAQTDSPASVGFAVRLGSIIDLPYTASGHVLLAFQDEETRASMLDARREEGAPAAPPDLADRLELIRGRGYEEIDSFQIRGVRDISFPLLDVRGHAAAALTIPFLERIDGNGPRTPEAVRDRLAHAAARLSALLGARAQDAAGSPLPSRGTGPGR